MKKRHPPATVPDPAVDNARIRPGQRRLIFATANTIGLRDEQLHDLVEWASGDRTRAIALLTVAEARRLTGVVKKIERNQARLRAEVALRVPVELDISDDVLLRAVRHRRDRAGTAA